MIHLYYDSKTGNVRRFIEKVIQVTGWSAHRIQEDMGVEVPGHLVTFTTNFGKIPTLTDDFMKSHNDKFFSVSSSGNRNWGRIFVVAGDKVAESYDIALGFNLEWSDTMEDINQFIVIIKNQYYDSKRGSKKLDIAK